MAYYLLDNNHIQAIFDRSSAAIQRLNSLNGWDSYGTSVIILGEIHAGHGMTVSTNPTRRAEYEEFIEKEFVPNATPITETTRFYYGEIMESLWKQQPPRASKTTTDEHLVSLGININDVWIAASSVEHNFVLVTQDRMQSIRDAVGDRLGFDCWI
ncbi:MAG: PIN domain-containing protein [Planctomycetota bacterium]